MRDTYQLISLAALALAAVNCGGGATGPGGGGGGSGFSATVNGVGWEAVPISIGAQAVGGVPGSFLVVGSQTSGGTTTSLTLTMYNVTGPGMYALGVSSEMDGGRGSVGEGTSSGSSNIWSTDLSGTAGTMTITRLSGGRLEATFSYTASEPGQNNTLGGTRTVTNGVIDLAFTGTLTPVPPNGGGKLSGTFNGTPYNASSGHALLTDHLGQPGVRVNTISSENTLSITLSGVTAPGTYTLSNTAPVRLLSAGRNTHPTNCCWGVNTPGDVGTITVTSITASRIQGTFSGTLQPHAGTPATTPLVITNGTFDVGVF